MNLYRILSLLFDYPDEDLQGHVDEIAASLAGVADLTAREHAVLAAFLVWLRATPLLTVQQHYVQTFDLTPELSLHLTHHSFGDDRRRGPALIELAEHYRAHGLEAGPRELPDYLPLILEFLATRDADGARAFLGRLHEVLRLLAGRLEQAASAYAPLMHLLAERARHAAHAEAPPQREPGKAGFELSHSF